MNATHSHAETNDDSSLIRRIQGARAWFAAWGAAALADPDLARGLTAYSDRIADTQALMREFGVVDRCSACALDGPGSCCFHGIESDFDEGLLAVNLMMGIPLPDLREVEGSCFFVGSAGCKLRARCYFCVHYLCPDLSRAMGEDRVRVLLFAVGRELAAGWNLEQALRTWTRQREPIPAVDQEAGGRN